NEVQAGSRRDLKYRGGGVQVYSWLIDSYDGMMGHYYCTKFLMTTPSSVFHKDFDNIVLGMMSWSNGFFAKTMIPDHHAVQIPLTKRQHALNRMKNKLRYYHS
uniref:hypothetical protein n=1 Tax=Xenorhabdus eapokensis TaxID=1873482 RepID=UPI000AEB89DF